MPFGEIVPVLKMLPETVAAVTAIRVIVTVLAQAGALPVMVVGQGASAGGVPIPMSSAATEVEANKARVRDQPARPAASAKPLCALIRTKFPCPDRNAIRPAPMEASKESMRCNRILP